MEDFYTEDFENEYDESFTGGKKRSKRRSKGKSKRSKSKSRKPKRSKGSKKSRLHKKSKGSKKKKTKRKLPSALKKPLKVSKNLQKIIKTSKAPRSEINKKLWAYIKKNKCQHKNDGRVIILDAHLAELFGKKKGSQIHGFKDMPKLLKKHIM